MDESVDSLQTEWISRFRLAAWSLSEDTETVCLISYAQDNENTYQVVGKTSFPKGAGELIDKMALFSRANMEGEPISNHPKGFPLRVYWLKSLLMAAYPRSDGIFNGNNGAAHVLSSFYDMDKNLFQYCIFQGVGVLLVDMMREFVCEYESEDNLIKVAKDYWIFTEELT
jgi:hypothetical protein